MTKEELRSQLINEAQAGWNKLVPCKRLCGSVFSYYDGYIDCGIEKEKRIEKLKKENAELKEQCNILDKSLGNILDKSLATSTENNIEIQKIIDEHKGQLAKAKEIILKLYNAGRDVLMCRAEEKAYDNLANAINDRSIEQFFREVENDLNLVESILTVCMCIDADCDNIQEHESRLLTLACKKLVAMKEIILKM